MKTKLCKYCKTRQPLEEGNQTPVGWFCSYDHAIKYANDKSERARLRAKAKAIKEDKKKWAGRKQEFRDNDLKTRKAAAKLWCHAYIRERDKGLNCICCNRPMGKVDAGHWLESGNYSSTRYDEDNIHAQSVHCNQYKGGDSGDYEENLRIKIGDERVDALKAKKNEVVKRTCEDYKEIEEYYKAKLKVLKEL